MRWNFFNVTLPVRVESIVLQNVLQWLQSENLDIRWMAVRILFALSRNDENNGIVDFGIMLYDTDFKEKNADGGWKKADATYYRAKMENGVIIVPPKDSEEVLR